MNVQAVAEHLQVSPSVVYGVIASGKLKCYRIGNGRGIFRISEEHVEEYLQSVEVGVASMSPVVLPPRRPIKLKHLRAKS